MKGLFLESPMICLTATSSENSINLLIQKLCLSSPLIVTASPNRENIFRKKFIRDETTRPFESHKKIFEPLANELLQVKKGFPMTSVYMKLKYCGYAYKFFEEILGNEQYIDSKISPLNRLFCQYHAPQTANMKRKILEEVIRCDSNIRVIFATSALGMGVNIPHVERVIHISPPSLLEQYLQHIGRDGRSIRQAEAILYYNGHDISSVSHVYSNMKEYCLLKKSCLRKYLIVFFGFEVKNPTNCCSNCSPEVNTSEPLPELKFREVVQNKNILKEELISLIDQLAMIDCWGFTNNVKESGVLADLIIKSVEFITDEIYLLEHFGVWHEKIAKNMIDCLDKYAPRFNN